MKPVFCLAGVLSIQHLITPILFVAPVWIAGIVHGQTMTFEGSTDIGKVSRPGSISRDSVHNILRVTGSGENIWGTEDAFFFVWRKIEGDVALKTSLEWQGEGKHQHRKAGWMIRAGLGSDDAYVDAVAHGDGLISMQFRTAKGATTAEVQSAVRAPATMLLERTGDQVTLTVVQDNGPAHPVATMSMVLAGQLYAGLAVCSHDSTASETAVFTGIEFAQTGIVAPEKRVVESTLETIDIRTGLRTIIRRAKEHFEAPNWSRDGGTFYYNRGGRIYTLPVTGGTPEQLYTAFADRCNNDHGLSPDGKSLVISHHGGPDGTSLIFILPSKGGEPRQVTPMGPSYWHGWSPDGKTLAYCAERDGEYDVYTIPVEGGQEIRLTTARGLDDGPEYSPDGTYIYFNSVRTGQMKIWRMKPDGTDQIQVTPDDAYGDWFAHPSPDGKWIVLLSYDKSVEGHPANKDVALRIMPAAGGAPKILATLFGGQGTINVPSWSPDSTMVACVSYRLVAP